jgi:hypothetical protein
MSLEYHYAGGFRDRSRHRLCAEQNTTTACGRLECGAFGVLGYGCHEFASVQFMLPAGRQPGILQIRINRLKAQGSCAISAIVRTDGGLS